MSAKYILKCHVPTQNKENIRNLSSLYRKTNYKGHDKFLVEFLFKFF